MLRRGAVWGISTAVFFGVAATFAWVLLQEAGPEAPASQDVGSKEFSSKVSIGTPRPALLKAAEASEAAVGGSAVLAIGDELEAKSGSGILPSSLGEADRSPADARLSRGERTELREQIVEAAQEIYSRLGRTNRSESKGFFARW